MRNPIARGGANARPHASGDRREGRGPDRTPAADARSPSAPGRRRAPLVRLLGRPLPSPERVPEVPGGVHEGSAGGDRAHSFRVFGHLRRNSEALGAPARGGPGVSPGHENSPSGCAGILPPQAPADLGVSTQVSIFRRSPCTQTAPTARPAPPRRSQGGRRRRAAGGGQRLLLRRLVGGLGRRVLADIAPEQPIEQRERHGDGDGQRGA